MSCRAFGRRIKDRCFEELFARLGVFEIEFDYMNTHRNEPFCKFLEEMLGVPPMPRCRLSREQFLKRHPGTFHRIQEGGSG